VIIGWVCSAFLCGYIASQKNRGGIGWFFAGLAFGIFAVIAIVAVPSLSEEETKQRERDAMGEEDPNLEEWKQKMKRKL
jgi:Na+/melibiose symporter-like transporter